MKKHLIELLPAVKFTEQKTRAAIECQQHFDLHKAAFERGEVDVQELKRASKALDAAIIVMQGPIDELIETVEAFGLARAALYSSATRGAAIEERAH